MITERIPSAHPSPSRSPIETKAINFERSSPEMRQGIQHRSDTNLFPYADEETTESKFCS